MTGGRVIVLGHTGRNFAAGMSGGIAYVMDWNGDFATRCNQQMVQLEELVDKEEIAFVHQMITKHAENTSSLLAHRILSNWDKYRQRFVQVMPNDYKRIRQAAQALKESMMDSESVAMTAFEMNQTDLVRSDGN